MTDALKTSAYGYLIGDVSLMGAGWLKAMHEAKYEEVNKVERLRATPISITETKKFGEVVGGAFYGLAGITGARYGNPSAEKKLDLLYADMAKYLKQKKVTIPDAAHTTPELLAVDDGIIAHIERFMYRHPTQVMSAIFAVGGVISLRSGFKGTDGQMSLGTIAAGALVTIGGLAGLLGKETKPKPGEEESYLQSLKHNPLKISALAYTLNNGFSAYGALMEDRIKYAHSITPAKYAWMPKLLTVCVYLGSNYFLNKSSQHNTASTTADHDKIIGAVQDLSARIVAAQPPEVQHALVQQLAGYLASRAEVNAPASEVAAAIQASLHARAHGVPAAESWQARSQKTLPEFSRGT